MVTSKFRVEVADEADYTEIAAITMSSFEAVPVEAVISGPPTEANIQAAAKRIRHAARLHHDRFSDAPIIKCVHTDPKSGLETIVGCAQWYMYTDKRTEEEAKVPHYLLSAEWVEDGSDKEKALNFMEPFLQARVQRMGTNPYGLLMYMAVRPEWRRQGASTMCVKWGLNKCQELGIPAYLEASEMGAPVYQKLGFEAVDDIPFLWDGEVKGSCLIMIKPPR
ncbi:hypothetical protein K461DRAFT_283477 [Myriangium duriaei CBS 260.36]|uniref:N-acetyltransferase domain-containing protein n=1 Tax=Myriangium duriaei CBS 260.36 TaxID=1168546 RepID=A0A9P4IQL6_9PEZI|nr:hypothetical protein K461DRAFT_283477 [Myriangium duriaei CBS 260.36]